VEGPTLSAEPFDPTVIPEMRNRRYPATSQAMALVDAVGPANLYAAFFLGRPELVGGHR